MQLAPERIEIFREQLERILASAEFSGSRQAHDFLAYVGGAAFQDRTHVDQSEIARRVLLRDDDFNPVDDTSVRKLASVTRQKLEKYYAAQGRNDPVLVTLPHRLYIPHFQLREQDTPKIQTAPAELESPPTLRRVSGIVLWVSVAILAVIGFWGWRYARQETAVRIVLMTKTGDIANHSASLPPDGIRLGMEVGPDEDIMARMVFTPAGANQHAGLMFFASPDQFVKLGRRFFARTDIEFGMQVRGAYAKPPGTFSFDPKGQDGTPTWLSMRREGNVFRAYNSVDGDSWTPVGSALTMPDPMPMARLALYAMQEVTGEPPASAEFDHVGAGVMFHHRADGPLDANAFSTWKPETTCQEADGFRIGDGALEFAFNRHRTNCAWEFTRAVPSGDWAFSTRMDLLSFDGAGGGIAVHGAKKRFRLLRWSVAGGSVSAQLSPGPIASVPDFRGSPPLWLRIECRRGILSGSFSRDNRMFVRIPLEVSLSDLGSDARVGIHTSAQSWTSSETLPLARFFFVQQEALSLRNYR